MLRVGITKETSRGETRIAVVPTMVSGLTKSRCRVVVQAGAGLKASFTDQQYRDAGALIINDPLEFYKVSDVVLRVQPPQPGTQEMKLLRKGTVLMGLLASLDNPKLVVKLAKQNITSFAMEHIPRISRAQSMDALTSMATVAGYKAVLVAANQLGKFFPLLMSAAGTIRSANVLVLGAGVAGLQAVATARRLGAKVEVFDPRPVVKEQVRSLGAQFIDIGPLEDIETEEGYAKEQSEEFLKKEREIISSRLPRVDVVIATAQVIGKRAPLLVTEEMVNIMQSGSVIVDLAARRGGNCALTQADKVVEKYGTIILGFTNLEASMPVHASQLYSRNITNLFRHLYRTSDKLDFSDEITKAACITHNGKIVNETVLRAIQNEGPEHE